MKRLLLTCFLTFFVLGAAHAADPTGTWHWTHDEDGATINNAVKLKYDGNKVTGVYQRNEDPEVKLTAAKIDGDKLSYEFSIVAEGQTVKFSFSGKIKGEEHKGNVVISSGDKSVKMAWKSKRK